MSFLFAIENKMTFFNYVKNIWEKQCKFRVWIWKNVAHKYIRKKKLCPDYEIIEWNEDNFDVMQNAYMKYCYDNKKWAFLSDLARLLIVNEHGGIYFDTDVELVQRPDVLLEYEAFYGFETSQYVNTGVGFGAIAHHKTVESMIEQYRQLKPDERGKYPLISCPQLNTKALLPYGLQLTGERQVLQGAVILPVDYMNPYDDPTGVLNRTENTISIHWYSKAGWIAGRY